ncbi:hypothetical protein M8C21_007888, partial [Ambrosia artemisiifolia]
MELLILVLTSLPFFFILHFINHNHNRNRRLPPGPTGLPIIGNLLDLGPKPHESLAKLSKKHGPLMTIRLGSTTTVVASTPEAAREILQHNDEACSGRVVPDAVSSLPDNDVAMAWIPANDEFRTMRKALSICLTNQHKLDTFRDLRQNVVQGMLDFLNESGRKKANVDIGKLAFAVALNMMSNTCLSRNVTNYESDDIAGFKSAVKTVMNMVGKFNIADIFPILKPLDPQNIRRQGKAAYGWLEKIVEGFISERLKYRESKLARFGDMLDSLLDYSENNEAEFTLKHIKILLVELFLAGTETSSNTTEWAMTELLLNPDMMCPGIPVAQRVVSLMVASFVYHCDWKLPHAREEMNMEDIFGLTLFRATPLLASPIPVA